MTSYGRLSKSQRKTLRKFVRGKIIHDLGAGDLTLSGELLDLGAAEVYAVDKERRHYGPTADSRLHFKQARFHELTSPMDLVFLSWPVNAEEVGLVPIMKRASTVIYLGCNTGGSMCATPDFFRALLLRELLAYDPHRENSLIVTGKFTGAPRQPTGEELAGLSVMTSYYSFEQAEALGF